MDVAYRFIIYNPTTMQNLGSGPITTGLSWEIERRINSIGDYTCSFLAEDIQAKHVKDGVGLACQIIVPGKGMLEVGRGEIYATETSGGVITARGYEGTRRLAERSVGFLDIADASGNPVDMNTALGKIKAIDGAQGWNFTSLVSDQVSFGFSGESIFAALVKLTQLVPDLFFYFQYPNIIYFRNTFFPQHIRAIEVPPDPDPLDLHTCYITGEPRVTVDRTGILTRIRPYGHGERKEALNIATATYAPTGYTVNKTANYVAHKGTETSLGRIIEKAQKFSEVELIFPDTYKTLDPNVPAQKTQMTTMETTAKREAGNTLVRLAVAELEHYTVPNISFEVDLLHCNEVVVPGSAMRCIFSYRMSGAWVKVDQVLNVVGSTIRIDNNGLRTTNLTIADFNRLPNDKNQPLIQQYKKGARI